MEVLATGVPAAKEHPGVTSPSLVVSSRRTNYLLTVLMVVLIALTGLLADLALQLNQAV